MHVCCGKPSNNGGGEKKKEKKDKKNKKGKKKNRKNKKNKKNKKKKNKRLLLAKLLGFQEPEEEPSQ